MTVMVMDPGGTMLKALPVSSFVSPTIVIQTRCAWGCLMGLDLLLRVILGLRRHPPRVLPSTRACPIPPTPVHQEDMATMISIISIPTTPTMVRLLLQIAFLPSGISTMPVGHPMILLALLQQATHPSVAKMVSSNGKLEDPVILLPLRHPGKRQCTVVPRIQLKVSRQLVVLPVS